MSSIGFNLVSGIVKKSLRGSIEYNNENGAMTRITISKTYYFRYQTLQSWDRVRRVVGKTEHLMTSLN